MNLNERMVSNVKTFILVAWPLGCLLIALAVVICWEDYETSRAGYLALPTLKVNRDWVTFAVAALPQAGQLVLYAIFVRDTKKYWAGGFAIVFFLADIGTDSWYKSGGDWSLMPLAIAESLFIFTLGSEMLFTVSVGFVAEAFDEFSASVSVLAERIMNAFGDGLRRMGVMEEPKKYQQSNPQYQQHNK